MKIHALISKLSKSQNIVCFNVFNQQGIFKKLYKSIYLVIFSSSSPRQFTFGLRPTHEI